VEAPRHPQGPVKYFTSPTSTMLSIATPIRARGVFVEEGHEQLDAKRQTPDPEHMFAPEVQRAGEQLRRMRLVRLDAARLHEPSERLEVSMLASDASNLPAVLAALEPRELGEIRADLVSLVPGLTSFDVVPSNESLHIEFDFSGGERLPARIVSDGTLRLLALFTALRAAPKPLLLGIEEPENGVYPGKLRALLELLQESLSPAGAPPAGGAEGGASSAQMRPRFGTQLVLTTHSPVVLAALRSTPECLRFLDLVRHDGQLVTRARKVAPSITPAQARDFVSVREVDRLLNSLKAEVAEVAEAGE
jgi:hypothetical protein